MIEVPVEFLRDLEKVKRERALASDMIKFYTLKWVGWQKKYIEMLDFIERREK